MDPMMTQDGGLPQDPSIQDPSMQEDPSQDLSPEDMRGNLEMMMGQVDDKYREMNSTMFSGKNQTEAARRDAIKQALEMMRAQGVDVNDPQSIQDFLDKLERENPDLAQLFEEAFNSLLLGDEDMPPPPEVTEQPVVEAPPLGEMGQPLPSEMDSGAQV
jgi:hypothetical protein